jgi:hypothetical protein
VYVPIAGGADLDRRTPRIRGRLEVFRHFGRIAHKQAIDGLLLRLAMSDQTEPLFEK